MPDISMCQSLECEISHRCYRFLARPDRDRQTYAHFQGGYDGCPHFISAGSYGARDVRTYEEAVQDAVSAVGP